MSHGSKSTRSGAASRAGSVMVEFALISFALYMLVAAMLELGKGVFAAQMIQTAADTMARELALAPLPATSTFEEALASPYVRARVFDEAALVIDLAQHPVGPELDEHFSTLPIVNQMLRPVMISDTLVTSAGALQVLRYPGAVVSGPNGLTTVRIPRVVSRSSDGVETIDWLGVVEEVLPANSPESHFGIDAPLPAFKGLVSLRINYPYRASTLSAFIATGASSGTTQRVVSANDGAVTDLGLPPEYSTTQPGDPAEGSPYGGAYGLGKHYALNQSVRPWRKLLAAQAVRRREVTY